MSKAKPIRKSPSQKYLSELFTYDPMSGILTWKTRPRQHFISYKGWAVWNANNAGNRAGNLRPNGYRRVLVDGVSFPEHRIIWKLVLAVDPPETIDHVDRNPSNNKWSNLRTANHTEQKWNMRIRTDNTSGYRGVSRSGNRWLARMFNRHLGCFATREEASAVYENIARKLHGKFYRET